MTIKYPFYLFSLLLFFANQIYSQHEIHGNLVTYEEAPVPFANVILLDAQDSVSVYLGTVADESGEFLFENVEEETYLLKASFVGYDPLIRKIQVVGNVEVGTLQMAESEEYLEEITVNARKPKITRSIDRLTFDVENSTLSSGNSWEVLQQTPGVILNQGQLQVRNGAVTVYINDRKVQLSPAELETLLQSFSAENLKSVEVITNPPARYEAEGGAILNINTTKILTPGYKGSLEGNYTQGIVPKYQIGTSHYWKGEKLNLFANYSFSPRKEIKRDESHIYYNENGQIFSRWNTDFERITRSQAHNVNVILDYDFNEKNRLSFSSNIMVSPNQTFNNSVDTDISSNRNQAFNNLITDSDVNTDDQNIALDLTYAHHFENGARFSINSHYTKYKQERDQTVDTDYFSGDGKMVNNISFNTDALQDIDIITAQADYSNPFEGGNFDTGAKFSTIHSLSGIGFFDAESLQDLYDNLNDSFRYKENIFAGYVNISQDWENWSAQAGLRGEYTDLVGRSVITGEENPQEYFELFPTAYLQYRASENQSFTFDYSRRIDRPNYDDLNPFKYFLNENDFNAGNPNLRAAISNNFNLNYTLNGQYFFDAYYRNYGNSPSTLAFQNNDRQFIRRVSMNLLENKTYGLDFLHGRSITGRWYGQLYTSIFHEENKFLALESKNETATNEIDGLFTQFYNSFTLSKDGTFSGNLTLLYISDYMSGSYTFDPFSTLSLGFRKTLWNNRAELILNLNDVFNQTNTRLTSAYLNQDNSFFAREETRYVQLGFRFNFGNFRLEDNQRTIEAAERERL